MQLWLTVNLILPSIRNEGGRKGEALRRLFMAREAWRGIRKRGADEMNSLQGGI